MRRLLRRLVRVAHRLFRAHRLEGCTLIDIAGRAFRGRCCRCGYVDDEAWELIGPVSH